MTDTSRKNGFLLPLALLSLLVVSIIAINGFTYIQHHTTLLTQGESSVKINLQQQKFELLYVSGGTPVIAVAPTREINSICGNGEVVSNCILDDCCHKWSLCFCCILQWSQLSENSAERCVYSESSNVSTTY